MTRKIFLEQVDTMRNGANVRRMHTLPTNLENTVGQHSYNAMALCWLTLRGTPEELRLLRLCVITLLLHDQPEQKFGDIPSPAKKAIGAHMLQPLEEEWSAAKLQVLASDVAQPGTLAAKLCHFFDCVELALQMKDEQLRGNVHPRIKECAQNAYAGALAYRDAIFRSPAVSKELKYKLSELTNHIEPKGVFT